MYKVFVDNLSICFQKDSFFKSNISSDFFPTVAINKYKSFLKEIERLNVKEEVFIQSPNPVEQVKEVFADFEWIEAAGGIVQNTKTKKLLFIFRNGLWDIPKGKIEKDENPKEGAIREIEEECGLKNLKITSELSPTYHVYFAYGKHFIKKTYWFTLETKEEKVEPQTEEGITEVQWFNKYDLSIIKKNTFASILEVMEEFSFKSK
ncbi:NUDIX hydrolase [Brumimicrobium oceani]|uniref:NUDIX hydrolase n=1 Tax=Brumimicrobium oceani TaxID=2100725 RepID=A0A2U2XGZ0_9FLAO|nr:NUDIX domain-containing protein [Brumimicrobium oceani]PWH87068.1 NUDIX hydrolase [Brumimicrobium oceani]